jgi:hypothetical protein
VAVDPSDSTQQPYASVVEVEYEIGRIPVTDTETGNSYETDVHGLFSYSSEVAEAMPVILLLHGRHQTCETPNGVVYPLADDDSCPNNGVAVTADSFRGYSYLVDVMAKAGYFVLSIDANDINDSDGGSTSGDAGANARAQLIKQHLDDFREVNISGNTLSGDDSFPELVGKLDMEHIGIMGHSRGGDGIARFVRFNREQDEPHNLVAAFGLAPTDYNREYVDGVTWATLLPYCDGDVEDVQGAFVYDDTRYEDPNDPYPKFQILTMGGNHNYFNRVWTSDDWTIWEPAGTDPHCGTNTLTNARDSREEQEGYGLFFMASFFRAFVGQETDFLSYWNGQAYVPDSGCPSFSGPCPERHHLTIHAGADKRLVVEDFIEDAVPTTNQLGGSLTFDSFTQVLACDPAGFDETTDTPCPSDPTFNTTPQVYLQWDEPAEITATFAKQAVTDYDVVSVRVGVVLGDSNNENGQDFSVILSDDLDHQQAVLASSLSHSLFYPPGRDHGDSEGGSAKTLLNAIDIPLSEFDQVDLNRVTEVKIQFAQTTAGSVQVSDLLFQKVSP